MKRLAWILSVLLFAMSAFATTSVCTGNLTLLGFQAEWQQLDVELENTYQTPQSGGLAVQFLMNGQNNHWWFSGINVPAYTRWDVMIEFPLPITIIGVSACSQRPDGIIDAPDPVANKVKQKKH